MNIIKVFHNDIPEIHFVAENIAEAKQLKKVYSNSVKYLPNNEAVMRFNYASIVLTLIEERKPDEEQPT